MFTSASTKHIDEYWQYFFGCWVCVPWHRASCALHGWGLSEHMGKLRLWKLSVFCLLSNEWPMAYVWHQLRMTSWSPLTDIVMNAVETSCCSLVYPKPLVFMYFVIEMQFHADGSFIWRGYPALERSWHVFRSFDLFYNLDYSSIF